MVFYFDDQFKALASDLDKIGQSSYKLELLVQDSRTWEIFEFLQEKEKFLLALAKDIKGLREELTVEVIDGEAA